MPQIGTVIKGIELGYRGYDKYIWTQCSVCKQCRWVLVRHTKPQRERCRKCAGQTHQPSPETIEKARQANLGAKRSIESRERMRLAHLGKRKSPETLELITKYHITKEELQYKYHILKMSLGEIAKQYNCDGVTILHKLEQFNIIRRSVKEAVNLPNNIARLENYRHAKVIKAKMSKILLKHWQGAEYIRKQMVARGVKPNKAENRLQEILDKYFPNEWKYTGDGQVILGGRCPDFTNCNGKKEVIELFGSYWHRELFSEPQKVNHYKQYGFSCLVIWEYELKNLTTLMPKLIAFGKEV